MISETKLLKFLEICNSKDKTHVRLFKMYSKSLNKSDFIEIVDNLINSNINSSNLEKLKSSIFLDSKVNSINSSIIEKTSFGRAERFLDYFNLYNKSNLSNLSFSPRKHKISIKDDEIKEDIKNCYLKDNEIKKAKVSDFEIPGLGESEEINDFKDNTKLNNTVFLNNVLDKKGDMSYMYLPLQCKLCGLRYEENQTNEFGIHIEDHRRKTKALGDKAILRREFFHKAEDKGEKIDFILSGKSELLVWEKNAPTCKVCSKIIKKIWNDEVENWILEGGTKINEKEFAHKSCVI